MRALGEIGAEPTAWSFASMSCQYRRAFLDEAGLVVFPHDVLPLGVGAAVPDVLVATLIEALADFGAGFQQGGIDVVRGRQLVFVQQVEIAPDADTVAVVAPGEIALRLRRTERCAVACRGRPRTRNIQCCCKARTRVARRSAIRTSASYESRCIHSDFVWEVS